jgi:hypothetical protein
MMVAVHLKKQANLWIYENLETRGEKKKWWSSIFDFYFTGLFKSSTHITFKIYRYK